MSTITLDTMTLEILLDESPENPRDGDHLGAMACWHRQCTEHLRAPSLRRIGGKD